MSRKKIAGLITVSLASVLMLTASDAATLTGIYTLPKMPLQRLAPESIVTAPILPKKSLQKSYGKDQAVESPQPSGSTHAGPAIRH